ncbi:MAG TPA: hypothetical protein VIM79_18015 [Niastella sp.]
MKKKTFNLVNTTTTSTSIHTIGNSTTAERILLDSSLPAPPSEETVARLNAIAREYPFCAYIKQNNLFLL